MKRSTNLNRHRRASGYALLVELCRHVGMTDQQIVDAVAKANTPARTPSEITEAERALCPPATGPCDDETLVTEAAIAAEAWSK